MRLSSLASGMLLTVALMLCGSPAIAGTSPVAGLPLRHNGNDLKVAWNVQSDRQTVVNGVIKNIQYIPARDFDVAVFLVDSDNRVVASNRDYPLPVPIVDHDILPFTVTMNRAAPESFRYVDFSIRYRTIDETGWWNSTFRYDTATGRETEVKSLYRDDW